MCCYQASVELHYDHSLESGVFRSCECCTGVVFRCPGDLLSLLPVVVQLSVPADDLHPVPGAEPEEHVVHLVQRRAQLGHSRGHGYTGVSVVCVVCVCVCVCIWCVCVCVYLQGDPLL